MAKWGFVAVTIVVFCGCISFGAGIYNGGSGIVEDPYQISTAEQLHELGLHDEDWDKSFVLISDIDLQGFNLTPIGYDYWKSFTGSFDGGGHIISNLSITFYNGSLFGHLGFEAKVTNLGIKDVRISGWSSVAGLAGNNDGLVSQCYVTGEVIGDSDTVFCGGLIGYNTGIVRDCYSRANVTGNRSVGGLIGQGFGVEISRCYSAGTVKGSGYKTGGFIGGVHDTSIVYYNDCFWDEMIYEKPPYEWDANDGYLARNTYEMQNLGTYNFSGWGGDVWTLDVGKDYPRLAWEGADGVAIRGPEGYGSGENPFEVSTAFDLIEIGRHTELFDQNFILMADIDMTHEITGYTNYFGAIIGRFYSFTGGFDGNGYVVSNVKMDIPIPTDFFFQAGLFGTIGEGGIVKNIGVENIQITGYYRNNGGIAGTLKNGTIEQCFSAGSIKSSHTNDGFVGGLVGENKGGLIRDCYSSCDISGGVLTGGICGYSSSGLLGNLLYNGVVLGIGGGLLGGGYDNVFSNCFWDKSINPEISDWIYGHHESLYGKSTFVLQAMSTYSHAGWDFDTPVWIINDGVDYPRLVWQEGIGPVDLIQDLIEVVDQMELHKGVTSSIKAKLKNALSKLDDQNLQNDIVAINSLQGLNNYLYAQQGKNISVQEAKDIMICIEQIIELLVN